jgi:gliding motility-associated-like protein
VNWITAGARNVSVSYKDEFGCVGKAASTTVNVNGLPTGTLTAPADLTLCKGDGIQLQASGGATYQWYRNGKPEFLATGSSYSAKDSGIYQVEIISAAGCRAMAAGLAPVTYKVIPHPEFQAVPACEGSAAVFTNLSTFSGSGTVTYQWDLGDGTRVASENIEHIYRKGGPYTVVLSAISSACPNAPENISSLIRITSAKPAINYGPIDAAAGKPVTLQARTFGQTYSWSPAAGLSAPDAATTDANLKKETYLTVAITDVGGCVTVDTAWVRVFPGNSIYVPTGFTPNGDGLNDRLYPIMAGFKELKFFRIYNRFGNLVHETNMMGREHGWDGTFKGQLQQSGGYTWALQAVDDQGNVVNKTGICSLLR